MKELSPYERFQLEKFGSIIPETIDNNGDDNREARAAEVREYEFLNPEL